MLFIVYGLIAINIVVYIIPYLISFAGVNNSFYNFLALGWKENEAIRDGEWYRLITAGFLHADVFHLLVNMFSLYNLGAALLENRLFEPVQFGIIYTVSLISGSLFSFWFNENPSVGASGAIFGLFGAYAAWAVLSGNMNAIANVLLNIVILVVITVSAQNIDNWGHAGGFVAGFALGIFYLMSAGARI